VEPHCAVGPGGQQLGAAAGSLLAPARAVMVVLVSKSKKGSPYESAACVYFSLKRGARHKLEHTWPWRSGAALAWARVVELSAFVCGLGTISATRAVVTGLAGV